MLETILHLISEILGERAKDWLARRQWAVILGSLLLTGLGVFIIFAYRGWTAVLGGAYIALIGLLGVLIAIFFWEYKSQPRVAEAQELVREAREILATLPTSHPLYHLVYKALDTATRAMEQAIKHASTLEESTFERRFSELQAAVHVARRLIYNEEFPI